MSIYSSKQNAPDGANRLLKAGSVELIFVLCAFSNLVMGRARFQKSIRATLGQSRRAATCI